MSETDLITVDQAIAVIDAAPVWPRIVRMKLEEAQGLRLAQDVKADRDYPPFEKSLMDGFAVRCADVKSTPVELEVIGEIAAGQIADFSIGPKQSVAIMTGAPLPNGADGVVPVEDSEIAGPYAGARAQRRPGSNHQTVQILHADDPSRFITHRGADCAAGTIVLRRGMKLEAAQLAVAASFGVSLVDIFAKPQAAVLSTGDELVAIDAMPGTAQIRNSNNIMLVSLLRRLGCDVTDLGTAPDNIEKIREMIQRGLQFDALFVTGGMSMGEYDFVPKILAELGVELKITKLRIKPGKPFVFGQKEKSFVFGLPGNPVSGFVCALRLCSRLLERMGGGEAREKWIFAKLESALEKNGSREFYQPAIFRGEFVSPLKWKGSADIYTLAQANGLIVRSENEPAIGAGTMVRVMEIPS
ncbi:MAG TPA: gephyrin-like molybdotransferase Glp [Tepidisphaeraceae bacterium]|nr:gephyrin-like molybdotransferase Glp [Tepidisphaeraceae bacterium]